MKTFASLLQHYVETSGMKQTRVASATHISYNYLLRLLAGERHPSESVVYKLAEALRLTASQTGDLLVTAGYAPPLSLLESSSAPQQSTAIMAKDTNQASQFVQQFYRLAQEVPEVLQGAFFQEMKHFLGYARYKYILAGGVNFLDLAVTSSHTLTDTPEIKQQDQIYLNVIAQLLGELQTSVQEEKSSEGKKESSVASEAMEDVLLALDRLIGEILTGHISTSNYEPHIIIRMFDALREGAPWEIRRRLAEALPHLCQLDVTGTEQLMNILRLDIDPLHGADIRRRVVEALPAFFASSPASFPAILRLLRPVTGDDMFVTLALIEASGDIQEQIRRWLIPTKSTVARKKRAELEAMTTLLQKYQIEIPQIQRQLLFLANEAEQQYIQFSLSLHHLLCAPETLLLSIQEGLQSSDTLLQIIAVRYLERLLPDKPVETLEMYREVLEKATHANVRRAVAKALPHLLRCLEEASLSIRTLARTVICTLATDVDIYIRRAVADYMMHMLHIDREFVLVLLRMMHRDKDRAIRNRLQPVVLHLAQIWLTSYAETTGLIDVSATPGHRNHAVGSLEDNHANNE